VPLSIWYDWQNDGIDPDEGEKNFGAVNHDLTPKPAYLALQTMTRELAGYKIARRIDDFGNRDFVLLFSKPHAVQKIAAWTLDKPHSVTLAIDGAKKMVLELRPLPNYIPLSEIK
jgi:hypothetical protein